MPNNFDEHLKKNGEYWKSRFEKLEESAIKKGADYYDSLDKEFRKAEKAIDAKINVWYQRFANNNKISLSEARKLLNSDELEEFKWSVEDYIKYGQENALTQEWMKELENASAKVHITRLEALKLHLQQEAEVLYGNQLDGIDKLAREIYSEGYYRTAFEVQKGFNMGWSFQGLDSRKLDKVLSKPWTADNKTFKDRVWENKTDLVSKVHTELTQSIMRGDAPDKAINAISKQFQVKKHKAGRLIMTESAYFSSAAQKDCFKELDVEKFEIVATLDSHTSPICQAMDGEVQDMKDFEPGVTAPPFHPWCRSTTVPYFDDDEGYRAARDAEGNTYYVPSNMKYPEWKEEFVNISTKTLTKTKSTTIMNSDSSLKRKESNVGEFAHLEIPMQKRYVKQIAQKYDIDISGLNIKIQRDKELLDLNITGSTDYKNIGRIDLFPNAFINEEILARTIFHEKHHVKQLRKYGVEYAQSNVFEMEKEAYAMEAEWFAKMVKKVKK